MSKKVVLITGCSTGIGKSLCEQFHHRGWCVVATARQLESLNDLKAKGIYTAQLDVTRKDEIHRVVENTVSDKGHIDMLINNAGYAMIGPAIEISDDDLQAQMHTNFIAPHMLARAIAPSMRIRGQGTIVNIGSISGVVSTPFSGAY